MSNYKEMTLAEIAQEIRDDWQNVNYAAEPYLSSMSTINNMTDQGYIADFPNAQVLYFLSNAQSWRGEVARNVKAELKRRVK